MRRFFFIWLCCVLGGLNLLAQEEPDTGTPAEFSTPFFLVPLAPSVTQITGGGVREMLELYSAPLLNREAIESAAARHEDYTRAELERRQKRLATFLCGLPRARARVWLKDLRGEQARQVQLWYGVQERFETVQTDRIRALVGAGARTETLERAGTVRDLQRERQDLVGKTWTDLFDDLEGDPGDCQPAARYTRLPRERLHLPLYIARFYFFRELPAPLRIRFIS